MPVGCDALRLPGLASIRSSAGDSTGPASIIRPATSTPRASPTTIGTAPLRAVSVAMPSPSTIVSGRLTRIDRPTS
jgi:hypothetical protein